MDSVWPTYDALRWLSPQQRRVLLEASSSLLDHYGVWLSLMQSIEVHARTPLLLPEVERDDEIWLFAADMLQLAVEYKGFTDSYAAYWAIRLAATTAIFVPSVQHLPELLTPAGAARYALSTFPFGPEKAVQLQRQREADHDAGLHDVPRPKEQDELIELEMNVDAFPRIVDHISDPELADEIRSWIRALAES